MLSSDKLSDILYYIQSYISGWLKLSDESNNFIRSLWKDQNMDLFKLITQSLYLIIYKSRT